MKVIINDEQLAMIANSIREKEGSETLMLAASMAFRIGGIQAISGSIAPLCGKTITEIANDRLRDIGGYAFYNCSRLVMAEVPLARSVGYCAFQNCRKLSEIEFPKVTSIDGSAFSGCSGLKVAKFPSVTSIGVSAFSGCTALEYVDFSGCTSVPTLGPNAFRNMPTACELRVPSALVDKWKTATNWSAYASQIVGV